MSKEEIKLVDYKSEWTDKFNLEKDKIREVLKPYSCETEHIGSTSVIQMTAKPIIDIAIKLETVEHVTKLVRPLSNLSYTYKGEYGLKGRHFFEKGNPRQYHLHIVDDTTEHWMRWIKFRDLLRKNKTIREEYIKLKTELAEKFHYERDKYTQGKSDFINSMIDVFKYSDIYLTIMSKNSTQATGLRFPVIDIDLCVSCESCVIICPEVFALHSNGKAYVFNPHSCHTCDCQEAIENCLVKAISWEYLA